jgi:replicative DNA helicase
VNFPLGADVAAWTTCRRLGKVHPHLWIRYEHVFLYACSGKRTRPVWTRLRHVATYGPMSAAPAVEALVPPQNVEAEESVLGAMLLSAGAVGAVTEILDASDFYRDRHGTIYRAMLALWAKGEPVDAITLADVLDERGELEAIGGRAKVAELAALVPATSNVEHYARIVKEMATLRGLVRVGMEIARLGQERPGETAHLVDRAEQIVFDLAQQRTTTDFAHIEDLLKESFERITHLYEAGAEITGIPSGFRELDQLTSGFQAGNLIILAARPSMGKSGLALCAAANLGVRHTIPVALFTLEMSKAEVTQRMMCSEAKVESQRLRSGRLAQDDWPRLTAACDKLMKAPIYVDDTGSITMMELRSKARRLKSREPKLGLIIVDYLQLMSTGASVENRVQEVSQISRQLKVLARDLEVPILALSQLSRAVEQRHDKRPILSDLRESGSIEQDSDLVAFVYRDDYYNGEESDQQGVAEIILAKHRNGPTGLVKLSFLKRYAKFADLAAA